MTRAICGIRHVASLIRATEIEEVNAMSPRSTFAEMLSRNEFARRHIGPSAADITKMLDVMGAASVDELIAQTPFAVRGSAEGH